MNDIDSDSDEEIIENLCITCGKTMGLECKDYCSTECYDKWVKLNSLGPDIKLSEFLLMSREVTENYLKAGVVASIDKQWEKIKEEEKEFENATSPLNELEEFWDSFFSKLRLLHYKKYEDYAILQSAISTWNKIYNRSIQKLKPNSETDFWESIEK